MSEWKSMRVDWPRVCGSRGRLPGPWPTASRDRGFGDGPKGTRGLVVDSDLEHEPEPETETYLKIR